MKENILLVTRLLAKVSKNTLIVTLQYISRRKLLLKSDPI